MNAKKSIFVLLSLFLLISFLTTKNKQIIKRQILAPNRVADYCIDERILNRWSPRALSGESISKEQLFSLFEAARWAPSSHNSQPWRFVYAMKDTKHWNSFLDLLVPVNKEWAQNASVLIIIISKKSFSYNKKPSQTHEFDTGSAWQNLGLQASIDGLVCHGIGGFDSKKAAQMLNLSDDYKIHAMCAIGKHGQMKDLPKSTQETPSNRKKVEEFAFEDLFVKEVE